MESGPHQTTNGNPFETPAFVDEETPAAKSALGTVFKVLALAAVVVVLVGLLMPLNRGREASRRTQCKNNLKQIALAFHNYYDDYESFPPAYTFDKNGYSLHSWRTLILPYLEQQGLYAKIDLSKPWNDPANAEASQMIPAVYRCPGVDLPEDHTNYLGLVGESLCFHPKKGRSFSEIIDGTSNTMMVMEVPQRDSVHWMSPQDADERIFLSLSTDDKLHHMGGIQAALIDGSVRFLAADLPAETRRALMSINGKEPLGEF